jgi:hypothetical protein
MLPTMPAFTIQRTRSANSRSMLLLTIVLLQSNLLIDALSSSSTASLKQIGRALVDYTAASEYVQSHYHLPFYFGTNNDGVVREEIVYDARQGVLSTKDGVGKPALLDECGFELFRSPTSVVNFSDMNQVRSRYLPELARSLIPQALGIDHEEIDSITFWHPMLRGEELSMQPRSQDHPSTAPVAAMVHMDTDVGAYGLDGILNLVETNRLDYDKDASTTSFDRQKMEAALAGGNRFLFLNIWRPLVPVASAPLGIMATHYEDDPRAYFPKATPCPKSSRWYIFSNMKPTECLVFKQYDRRMDKISDLWHCALDIPSSGSPRPSPRKSFDIKAMVILKEKVSQDQDRLLASTKPEMTLEQSGDFCESQCQREIPSNGNAS